MIYPPESVAKAALHAAEHPVRDVFIDSQARAVQLLGALFPRVVDKIMQVYMWPTQQDISRPSRPREESALHHAGYGLHERGTHHGWHRTRSWTVEATTHPVRTLVGAGAAGLGVLASRLPKIVR